MVEVHKGNGCTAGRRSGPLLDSARAASRRRTRVARRRPIVERNEGRDVADSSSAVDC